MHILGLGNIQLASHGRKGGAYEQQADADG